MYVSVSSSVGWILFRPSSPSPSGNVNWTGPFLPKIRFKPSKLGRNWTITAFSIFFILRISSRSRPCGGCHTTTTEQFESSTDDAGCNSMPHMREVKTCDRCRHFKRRCDLVKPSCSRCTQAGVRCSFDVHQIATLREHGNKRANATQDYIVRAMAMSSTNTQYAFAVNEHAPFPILPAAHLSASATISSASSAMEPASGALNGLISPTVTSESPEPASTVLPSGSSTSFEFQPATSGISSILSTATQTQRTVRKRKRNCLSCQRCHRLKVKCDKEMPCRRCKSSNNGRDCHYSYLKEPTGVRHASTLTTGDDGARKVALTTWKERFQDRGPSHWRDLVVKVRIIDVIRRKK